MAMDTQLEVQLLGHFEVRKAGLPVPVAPGSQRLIAFLALSSTPLARGYVAGTLWPDGTDKRAGANLRTTVWRLGAIGAELVEASPSRLGLCPSVRVDCRALVTAARPTRPSAGTNLPAGDLLPGWTEPWVEVQRERLRHLRAHALENRSREALDAGDLAAAADAARAALATDPTRESALRLLDEALAALPVFALDGAQGA